MDGHRGRPSTALASLGVAPASGWTEGVYAMPGAPSGGPPGIGGLLRVAIVVASELPRGRDTLLVRIMAGGPLLAPALAELATLPHDAPERAVASRDVLELRRALGSKERRSVEEEEFIVSTQDILEELRDEGRVEGVARSLLSALRLRGVTVPEEARKRIVAEKDLGRLERWFERAMVARSVGEVLDEPS